MDICRTHFLVELIIGVMFEPKCQKDPNTRNAQYAEHLKKKNICDITKCGLVCENQF